MGCRLPLLATVGQPAAPTINRDGKVGNRMSYLMVNWAYARSAILVLNPEFALPVGVPTYSPLAPWPTRAARPAGVALPTAWTAPATVQYTASQRQCSTISPMVD